MALLAEELVEEWLNRQGYFTIRGTRVGNHEIDLLAIRPNNDGTIECRQVEVQASVRPASYITKVPKEVQKTTGRTPANAKTRPDAELETGVREWVEKKFGLSEKQKIRSSLASGKWTRELVVHKVKHPREVEILVEQGIRVHRLEDLLAELKHQNYVIRGAAGAHLVDLVAISTDGK